MPSSKNQLQKRLACNLINRLAGRSISDDHGCSHLDGTVHFAVDIVLKQAVVDFRLTSRGTLTSAVLVPLVRSISNQNGCSWQTDRWHEVIKLKIG